MKVQIFGVRLDGIPRQYNYLVDESQTIGENGGNIHGPDAVISMLNHALTAYSIGEKECILHADNCSDMSRPTFRRHAEEFSRAKVERLRKKNADDVDHGQTRDEQPFCFKLQSTFTILILPFHLYPEDFQLFFKDAFLDLDMKDDLESANIINWCHTTHTLYPMKATGDGNCLLHALSLFMWGIDDKVLFLRRLLYITLTTDPKNRFKQRWLNSQRNCYTQPDPFDVRLNTEEYNVEWENVIRATEDTTGTGNFGLPYSTLEAFHLYVLANILRRPIIVYCDPRARTVYGQSIQESNIGGIYLPLEWNAAQCDKTPILIGYNMNHFAPLVATEDVVTEAVPNRTRPNQKCLVPLVTDDLSSMTIQYVLPEEEIEAPHLLTDYFRVDEAFVTRRSENLHVLCAKMKYKQLPDDLNVIKDLRLDCEKQFREWIALTSGAPVVFPFQPAAPVGSPQKQRPNQMNIVPGNVGEVPAAAPAPAPEIEAVTGRCITIGCKMFGNLEYSGLCSKCFKDFTIQYNKQEQEDRKRRLKQQQQQLQQQQQQLQQQQQQQIQTRRTANAHRREYVDISIMGEDCKAGCGFKCSTETYPYCHECTPAHGNTATPAQLNQRPKPQVNTRYQLESMMQDKCQTQGCQFFCSDGTYPFCHECFEKRRPETVTSRPTAPSASMITELNQAINGSLPPLTGVHPSDEEEQLLENTVSSSLPINLLQVSEASGGCPALPPSLGDAYPMNSPAVPMNPPMLAPVVSTPLTPFVVVPAINSSDIPHYVSTSASILLKPCQTKGCKHTVSPDNDRYCEACAASQMFGEGCENTPAPLNEENRLNIGGGTSSTGMSHTATCNTPNCQQKKAPFVSQCSHCFLENGTFPSQGAKPSVVEGLAETMSPAIQHPPHRMNDFPEYQEENYMSNNLNRPSPMKKDPLKMSASSTGSVVSSGSGSTQHLKYLCSIPGCSGIRVTGSQHDLCLSCLRGEGPVTSNAVQTTVRTTQIPTGSTGSDRSLVASLSPFELTSTMDRQLNPIVYSSKQKKKCVATSCDNMIYPPKRLCDNCTAILQKAHAEQLKTKEGSQDRPQSNPVRSFSTRVTSTRNHTAPLLAVANSAASPRHHTAPIVARSTTLCGIRGCEKFGDPNQLMKCAEHFMELVKKIPSSTGVAPQVNYPGPIAAPAVQAVVTRAGQVAVRPGQPQVTGPDQFKDVLMKVETSRKSKEKCMNNFKTGCNNYGNSAKKGYCNNCYRKVVAEEQDRRQALANQTQCG